jgi:hypothetical protein
MEILVSPVDIKYKEHLNYDNLFKIQTNKKIRCMPFDRNLLLKNEYEAKRYILKGKSICEKDVRITVKNKIRYDFGNMVIERSGKVIGENQKYIKIKDSNGKTYKIYKNGQEK